MYATLRTSTKTKKEGNCMEWYAKQGCTGRRAIIHAKAATFADVPNEIPHFFESFPRLRHWLYIVRVG